MGTKVENQGVRHELHFLNIPSKNLYSFHDSKGIPRRRFSTKHLFFLNFVRKQIIVDSELQNCKLYSKLHFRTVFLNAGNQRQ